MKKIIMIFVLVLLSIKVNAQENVKVNVEWVPNVYYNYEENGTRHWGQFAYIYTDDKIAYCLEINQKISTDVYSKSNEIQTNNLVILAGYFGYGYNGNNDLKDYMATQKLIWQYLGIDAYFTTKSEGKGYAIDVSEYERKIISSINGYAFFPSFNSNFKFLLGSNNLLEQSNSFIGQLKVLNESSNIISYDENMLRFIANESGNNAFYLEKSFNKNFDNNIYVANDSQKIMTIGSVNNLTRKYPYEIVSGSLNLKVILDDKYDKDEKLIEKNIFEIIDSSGISIGTYSPDSEGNIFIKDLALGNYVIKHIDVPEGYAKEIEEYTFEIADNCLNVSKEVHVNLKKIYFTIGKTYINPIINILNYDEGVKYSVYNEDGVCIQEKITNDLGLVTFELEYGNYKIMQSNTSFVENIHDDIIVDNTMFDKDIFYAIHDDIYKVSIKVAAVDKESQENIENFSLKFNQEENVMAENGIYIIRDLELGVYSFNDIYAEGYKELNGFDYEVNEHSNFYIDNGEAYIDLILHFEKIENNIEDNENKEDCKNDITEEIKNNDSIESNNNESNASEEADQEVIETDSTSNEKLPFLGDKSYDKSFKIFNLTNYIYMFNWMFKI